ncbi:glycosyltransferase [Candidatus Pacearchaeota archaeon]|nr:glycosyltransferase [Candidatus Pacearchaeota archaeon]
MQKLNYFTPLPPLKSGISDYSLELLKELSKYFEITVYTDRGYEPEKNNFYQIKDYKDFNNKNPVIYNIGNHCFHAYIYKTLLKKPGIVILHDSNLSHLNYSMMQEFWSRKRFLREVYKIHGLKAVLNYLRLFNYFRKLKNIQKNQIKFKKFMEFKERLHFSYPMNKNIIKNSKAIITHSEYVANIAKNIKKHIPIKIIKHGSFILKPKISKSYIREKNKLNENKFIICSFGKIQKHKRISQCLIAFKKFSEKNKNSKYLIIGEGEETINIKRLINNLNIKDKVIITGYLPFSKAIEYIYASDVGINLRYPSTGATSGSIIKSLSIGTPCIISDIPENRHFPDSCVFKIKKNKNEIENIIKVLEYLYNEPKTNKKISSNAINYINKHHLWENKAKEIANFINEVYK